MKPIQLTAATLSILFAMPAQSAMLAGSRPREWPASAEHHTVTIQRDAAGEKEQKLIATAEKVQPDAAALLEATPKGAGNAKPQAGQWWNKESFGIRIPFALTADAVQYYSDLVKNHGQLKLVRYSRPTSAFTYLAKVSKPASYELDGKSLQNVTVVTMTISFSQNFVASVTEGFRFEKNREVAFDKDGKVIQIKGDGDVEVPVFAM